ncbi:MAG TPA: histidine kinase [Ktedonobacteraceae bacterium]|jgi:two-component system sensor histidine kinase DesK
MKRYRDRHRAGAALQDAYAADPIISSGITFQVWRLYQHAWLACLFFPLAQVVRHPLAPGHVIVRGLSLALFAAGYTRVMWPHPASSQAPGLTRTRVSLLLLALLVLLVLTLSLLYGTAWLWLLLGISAMAGVLLPAMSAFAAVMFLTLLPLFLVVLTQGWPVGISLWWLFAFLLLIRGVGLDMIGVARMGSAVRELHDARLELAHVKVEEERQRLARDLHDLLGQTLAVITLKSELARSLITEDPVRCAQELAEVEQVGRRTLREVRTTVAGYRQPSLASELDGARQALSAVGIASTIQQETGELPPALAAVLAWALREGITNVIRHSRARHCLVQLTQEQNTVRLEILNDRRPAGEISAHLDGQGSGLRGLSERMGMLGGTMQATSPVIAGRAHFRLYVQIPLQEYAAAVPWQEEAGI